MANETIAQLDNTSQLIIFQLREVHQHLDKAWFDLEIARSDLRELMNISEKLEEEIEIKKKRLFFK